MPLLWCVFSSAEKHGESGPGDDPNVKSLAAGEGAKDADDIAEVGPVRSPCPVGMHGGDIWSMSLKVSGGIIADSVIPNVLPVPCSDTRLLESAWRVLVLCAELSSFPDVN